MTRADPDLERREALTMGQWRAFDRMLSWLNEQEGMTLSKSEIYAAIMEMRPTAVE